jgi:hypothetical protein
MTKTAFLAQLQQEQTEWEHFLAGIPEPQREQPGVCGIWSVKDVIAHVGMWERYAVGRLRAHLRAGKATRHELWGIHIPPSDAEDDRLNQWYVDQMQAYSYGEILGQQREIRIQMIATVDALDQQTLSAPEVVVAGFEWKKERPLTWVIGEMSYEHAQMHMRDIRQGLGLE